MFLVIWLPMSYRVPCIIVTRESLLKITALDVIHHNIVVFSMLEVRRNTRYGRMIQIGEYLTLLLKALVCLLYLLRIVMIEIAHHSLDDDDTLKGSLVSGQ